jgi:hypothetical protein
MSKRHYIDGAGFRKRKTPGLLPPKDTEALP